MKWLITFFAVFFTVLNIQAQLPEGTTNNPDAAILSFSDIALFLQAAEQLGPDSDSVQIMQKEYLDKGSIVLKKHIESNGFSAKGLIKAMNHYPEAYAGVGDLYEELIKKEHLFREVYRKIQTYLPNALFVPAGFIIGAYRGWNEATEVGLILSMEKEKSVEDKLHTLAHETIHIQQAIAQGLENYVSIYNDGPRRTLLALSIREGSAEFLTDLIAGRPIQEGALTYVKCNEKTLWLKFANDMDNRDPGDWMWNQPSDPDQPRDLGYAIGYRIVESYYLRMTDKVQAITDILSVLDYKNFLEKSGYGK